MRRVSALSQPCPLTQYLVRVALFISAINACVVAGGCSPQSYGTLITGSLENDELLGGKLDPANSMQRLVVYLCPPGMIEAEHYEDLARCHPVEIAGETAARQFRLALQTSPSGVVKALGPERRGTIMVVLQNGKRLYLHYIMRSNDVRLEAPPHGQERRVIYNTEIGNWLRKHVYSAEGYGASSESN